MRTTTTKTIGALASTLLAGATFLSLAPPAAGATAVVAVWNDPAYADAAAEGANTIAALEDTGATVSSFTGVTATAFTTALAGADVLVIPELEAGNAVGALEAGAESAITAFVNGGGTLLVFEPSFGSSLPLVNDLFGFTIAGASDGACPCSLTAAAAGTQFATGPAALPGLSANGSVTSASLPGGSTTIYESDGDTSLASVATVPVGAGSIILMGPDSFETMVGTPWIQALDLALGAAAGAAPTLSIDSVGVTEGDTAVLTATLSSVAATDVNVLFSTGNGTATGPDDFTPLASTVVIPAGQTTVTIEIDTIDDTAEEAAETFTVTIDTSTAGITLGEDVGTVTIAASDTAAAPAAPVPAAPSFTG